MDEAGGREKSMNATDSPTLYDQWWTFLRAMKETMLFVAGRVNIVRGPYERWSTQLPSSVQSVLFVCKGNICRSPLAAVYFRSLVERGRGGVTVLSAGLDTTPGKPAHPHSKVIATHGRLSLEAHSTTQIHEKLVEQSDLIVVMELRQKDRIYRLYPHAKGKVVLLGCFDSAGSLEIADPYSGTMDDFRACFEQVRRCCDRLASKLSIDSSPARPVASSSPE